MSVEPEPEPEPDPHEGMESIIIDNDEFVNGDLMLVNFDYGVPEKYEDADYPSIYGKGTPYVVRATDMYLQPQALDALREMLSAAKEDGVKGMMIVDGYRLNSKQKSMFDRRVKNLVDEGMSKEDATAKVAETVAYPGHSEHQIGLAVDVDLHEIEYEDFAETKFAKWLAENCYKYGYVLRYAADKTDITKIAYESWHFRYVGMGHAEYMQKNNLCLEEYIDKLHNEGVIEFDSEEDRHYTVTYIEKSDGGETECWIPENSEYTVSSDNVSGFVVLSWEK